MEHPDLRVYFKFLILSICLCLYLGALRHADASCSTKSGFDAQVYSTWSAHHGRSLKQLSLPKEGQNNSTKPLLILAQDRTERPDPLKSFETYREGWDIKNEHYWASAGFTGGPGFVLAAVWLILGLGYLLILCCCCCCCSEKLKGPHQGGNLVPLILLLIFTGAAVAGCILVYIGQGGSHDELSDTLNYVVGESDLVVTQLRNVSTALTQAQTINVLNFAIPNSEKTQIQQLNVQLTDAATDLETKTKENADNITTALNTIRLAMIIVAGVMLLLVLLGFLFATLGVTVCMYLLVFLAWFLVAGTWILCGVYIMLNNVIGDTCVAMEEWVANPSANTSLSEILPCVDVNTTNKALDQTRKVTNETVTGINTGITTRLNNGVTQGLPLMCNPVDSQLDASGCINIKSAPQQWLPYVCNSSANASAACPLGGRLTAEVYNQLDQSIDVLSNLNESTPFLLDLANCQFVRQVFTEIRKTHCHPLRKYIEWQYIGLSLISGGLMFSILLWIVFSRRRRHRFLHPQTAEPNNGQFIYRGPPEVLPKTG